MVSINLNYQHLNPLAPPRHVTPTSFCSLVFLTYWTTCTTFDSTPNTDFTHTLFNIIPCCVDRRQKEEPFSLFSVCVFFHSKLFDYVNCQCMLFVDWIYKIIFFKIVCVRVYQYHSQISLVLFLKLNC